jgi:hypothetical protein
MNSCNLLPKAAAVLVATLLSAGCVMPVYNFRAYAIADSPEMTSEQAFEVCVPEAELAGLRGRSMHESGKDEPVGYRCRTTSSGFDTYESECEEKPAASGGFVGGMADEMAAQNAYATNYNATLRSCMARTGWGLRTECVQNCQ